MFNIMSNKKTSFLKCQNCPYNNGTKSLLPIGLEDNKSNKLLVFQSPGKDEWAGGTSTVSKQRIPIDSTSCHSAANRMRKSFARKKVNRTDYDITEAVQCYPGRGKSRDKKPKKTAITCCQQYLENAILTLKYSEIVCFGEIAYSMVGSIIKNNKIYGINYHLEKHPSSSVSNKDLDQSY